MYFLSKENKKYYSLINHLDNEYIKELVTIINKSYLNNYKLIIKYEELDKDNNLIKPNDNFRHIKFHDLVKNESFYLKFPGNMTLIKILVNYSIETGVTYILHPILRIKKSGERKGFLLNINKQGNEEIRNVLRENIPYCFLFSRPHNFGGGEPGIIDFLLNLNFFPNHKVNENKIDEKYLYLYNEFTGILKLCLLKFITRNMEENIIKKIENSKYREIILNLKNEIKFQGDLKEDIKGLLQNKSGNNILEYSSYVNSIINNNNIEYFVNLLKKKEQNKVKEFSIDLSRYQEFNVLFENDFIKALENSYFDYSIISISICEKSNRLKYLTEKNNCQNCKTKYLFHGTQIDPISKIITGSFLYTRKAFYGMGIYFSDMLDYVAFYSGGETYENRRKNFGKTLPINSTFSLIASEVYYDQTKKKNIYDWSYFVKELDHFPSYEEIKKKYPDKMVEKNGIHFALVEPHHGQVKGQKESIIENSKGNFLGTEYVITEMDQIFPLYGITLKRNEYFVLWRDPNFEGNNQYSEYLKECKLFLNKTAKINSYFVGSTEKALSIIKIKKLNKIILITSVGFDLSGKRFVEIARKILGFNVMVLFFSSNIKNLSWIKNFPNALYTNNSTFYQKYVTSYNKEGLKKLKIEIEKNYKIQLLDFSKDFLEFPKFVNQKEYKDIIFNEICENFRKILIYNRKEKLFLLMEQNKIIASNKDKNIKDLIWYITIINNEITLFSNGYYISVDDDGKSINGNKYMKKWNLKQLEKEEYSFQYIFENKIVILTLKDGNISAQENVQNEYQNFYFIDVI